MSLDKDDVVNVGKEEKIFMDTSTFTVEEALDCLADLMEERGQWKKDGVKCRVIRPGKGWAKGTLRFSLEFIPDKEESPLDEFR